MVSRQEIFYTIINEENEKIEYHEAGGMADNVLLTRRCGGLLPQCAAGQVRYSERSG